MKLFLWLLSPMAIATAMTSAFTSAAFAQTPAPDTPTPAPAVAPVPAPPPLPEITRAQFTQINLGMTMAEVMQLLGQAGRGDRDWGQAEVGTTSYQWHVTEGDRIAQVVFNNGRVVGRTIWAVPRPTNNPGNASEANSAPSQPQTPEMPKPKP